MANKKLKNEPKAQTRPGTPLPRIRSKKFPVPSKSGFHEDKLWPTDVDAATAKSLASVGMSMTAIAQDLGISKATIERWCNEFPKFFEAIKTGRAYQKKRAYTCFFQQAFPVDREGKPTLKGDPSLMIFYAKTRLRWKEPPKDINIGGDAVSPPVIQFLAREAKKKDKSD